MILDLALPDGSGLELLPYLGSLDPATPVLIFSAHEVDAAIADRVASVLVKSQTSNRELLERIRSALGAGVRAAGCRGPQAKDVRRKDCKDGSFALALLAVLYRPFHLPSVQHHPVPPRALGLVEGGVGGLHEIPGAGAGRVDGDAAAQGGGHLAAAGGQAQAGEALADLVEHPQGGGAVGVGEEDGELVAAVAAEHVGAAEALPQQPGEALQQAVARRVAEGVVDRLEAVEVDHRVRHLPLLPVGAGDLDLDLLLEVAVVEQAGQAVVGDAASPGDGRAGRGPPRRPPGGRARSAW